MALEDEKCLLLTTFRRNGTPVSTPVWVVGLDGGDVGFYTSSASGKAKRLAHTERVTIQPCNSRGRVKPGTSAIDATARLVVGDQLETIRERVIAKYGFMTKVAKMGAKIGGLIKRKPFPYADRGVVVTPSPNS